MNPIMTAAVVKETKQLVDEARGFLAKLAGPAVEEAGLLIQDKVRLWRFKNQLRILGKAQQMLDESKLKPAPVPLRTLVPLLEGAALEEDPGLSDKWACLLANAGAQTVSLATHPAFPRILSEMTPGEAFFLDRLSQSGGRADWESFRKKIEQELAVSRDQVARDIGNLFRLGVCRITKKPEMENSVVEIAPFGSLFLKACSPPTPSPKAKSRNE